MAGNGSTPMLQIKKGMQSVCFPQWLLAALSVAVFGLSMGGCTRHVRSPAPRPELFWPPPPEVKRIEFVGAVSTPADMNIHPGIWKRLVRYIAGKGAASVVSPYGLATDSRDRLYVVDTFLKRIHVFDPAGNQYHFFPEESPMLASPVAIAIDAAGRVYVSDSRKGVVFIFNDGGHKFLAAVGAGIFKRPTGIAVNSKSSELLVVDTLQSRVYRFDLSDQRLKGSFGTDGAAEGMFHYPTNICTTRTGDIIVSDALNFRVQVFSSEGRFLRAIGRMGMMPGAFSRPKGVASDSDGHIYVVDALFDNIQIFDRRGRLLMAFGDHGSGDGKFWLPTGLHIDDNDRIYVSDSSNRRVQIFRYLKEDRNK
jgi:DNA-binding beta-propeller fold protein YncE